MQWDGQWYLEIAAKGCSYDPRRASRVAFFPLYPLLGKAVAAITGLETGWALVLVSHLALLGAFVLWPFYLQARLLGLDFRSSKDRVRDGLSNTFLAGEDLPERDAWCSWPQANNAHGTCAIPPNFTWNDPTWWPNTWSFRSNHPGGLQFGFADGSVRFVRQDIEREVYWALANRAGREPVPAGNE